MILVSGGLNVAAATELVLVRHGEAERGLSGLDRRDPWLSARGQEQARRVAQALSVETFGAVYSSHLRRAVQTAEPWCAANGSEPVLREGLAEFDRAAGEYMYFEDLRRTNDARYFACMRGDLTPWGTTYAKFRDEIVATVSEIVEAQAGKRILMFTHGGVLNVLLGWVLGLDRMWFFFPENAGICRVAVNEKGRMRVVTMNERAHLHGLLAEHQPVPEAAQPADRN